jgi:hypothetical protein
MPTKGQNYDSSGPDIRVRGNAYQVLEKYLQLARDAGTVGDRVAAENFLQHADHYYRVVASMNEGQRPRIGGREVSVADVNVHNVNQGLSAAMSGHGHSNASGDDQTSDEQDGGNGNGNGQARPQQQQSPQNPERNAYAASTGNGEAEPAAATGNVAADGNQDDAAQHRQGGEEQPDYPEELLPEGESAPNTDGQVEPRQHNRMGRGRRRGPGRRVRGEGEEPPNSGPSEPDNA